MSDYMVITEATIKGSNRDGSEIILEVDFFTDSPKHRCFSIRYSGTVNALSNAMREDLEYFLNKIDKRIPLTKKNRHLITHDSLLGEITTYDKVDNRKVVRNYFV